VNWPTLVVGMDAALLPTLGVPASYTTSAAVVVGIDKVIFDNGHTRVQANTVGVVDTRPWLFLRLSDLPVDPETDDGTFTVDGVNYKIVEPQRDGQGGMRCILRKA
jgi:hypothetical protein